MRSTPSSVAHWHRSGSLALRLGILALCLGLLASIAFVAFPGIDLEVSRLFFIGNRRFFGSIGWVKVLRNAFAGSFYLCIAAVVAGLILTGARGRSWLRLDFAQWAFLAIALAVGPGLVANAAFKDHWGRARPNAIVEFGGEKAFTPAAVPADQCDNNCSFVAGEAASVFLPFYAMALLLPEQAVLLLAAGTVCGLAAGLVRVAQGGHFLSDVIFAAIFMLLTAVVVHWAVSLLAARRRPRQQEQCQNDRGQAWVRSGHPGEPAPRRVGAPRYRG